MNQISDSRIYELTLNELLEGRTRSQKCTHVNEEEIYRQFITYIQKCFFKSGSINSLESPCKQRIMEEQEKL